MRLLSPVLGGLLALVIGSALGADHRPDVILGPDYMRAVGHLLGEERGVKWNEELCIEQVPESKPTVEAAYSSWAQAHAAFVTEVEQTIPFFDKHNLEIPRGARGLTSDQFRATLERFHQQYSQKLIAAGPTAIREMCAKYPAWVRSPAANFESSDAASLAQIRIYSSQ